MQEGAKEREDEQMAWFEKRREYEALNEEGLLSLSLAFRTPSAQCELFNQHAKNVLRGQKVGTWFATVARKDGEEVNSKVSPISIITDLDTLSSTLSSLSKVIEGEEGEKKVEGGGEASQESLKEKAKQVETLLFPFDHVRAGSPTAQYTVILYADFTSKEASKAHEMMTRRGEKSENTKSDAASNVDYVLRPFSKKAMEKEAGSSKGYLQGYGVELALKNVEYRVLDVQSLKAGLSAEAKESQDASLQSSSLRNFDGEPHAHIMDVISRAHPELKEKLEEIVANWWKDSLSSSPTPLNTPQSDSSDASDNATLPKQSLLEVSQAKMDSLALLALQTIYSSPDPLRTLRDIAQNLPSAAPLLALQELDDMGTEYLERHAMALDSAQNSFSLNGRSIDVENLDPFQLLSIVDEEVSKYKTIQTLSKKASETVLSRLGKTAGNFDEKLLEGFTHAQIQEYLKVNTESEAMPTIDLMWDDITMVLNDLEKAEEYEKWPKRVRDLLKPTWPGQLTPIAKNFFTILMVLDPSSGYDGVRLLGQLSKIVLQNSLPIRLAFHVAVPNPSRYESEWVEACSNLKADGCNTNWLWAKLLKSIHTSIPDFLTFMQFAEPHIDSLQGIKDAWESSGSAITWEEAISSNADFVARLYAHLSSAGIVEGHGITNYNLVLLNGKLLHVDPDQPLNEVGIHLQRSKQSFQRDIYQGKISDATDLYKYSLGDPSEVFPGFNGKIFETNPSFVSLSSSLGPLPLHRLPYLMPSESQSSLKTVTHLMIGDVAQSATREALKAWRDSILSFSSALSSSRLAFLPLPGSHTSPFYRAFEFALETLSSASSSAQQKENADSFLSLLLDTNSPQTQLSICKDDTSDACISFNAWMMKSPSDDGLFMSASQKSELASQLLRQAHLTISDLANTFAVVTNGRFVALNAEDLKTWDETAWFMLTKFELVKRATVVSGLMKLQHASYYESEEFDREKESGGREGKEEGLAQGIAGKAEKPLEDLLWLRGYDSEVKLLEGAQVDAEKIIRAATEARSDLLTYMVAELNRFPKAKKTAMAGEGMMGGEGGAKGIVVKSEDVERGEKRAMISGSLYIDPLSPLAQSLPHLLMLLMEKAPMEVRMVLMPRGGLSELPLKSFFRYVAGSSLRFDSNGSGSIVDIRAEFDHLPKDKVLTMNLKTHSSWLVENKKAPLDLDNILLHPVSLRRIEAQFELQSLLVEGSCSDMSNGGNPPRGLKLQLSPFSLPSSSSNSSTVDTLVMSNLGYFQLKANPGVWSLSLAQGRGKMIYDILGPKSSKTDFSTVIVNGFSSEMNNLRVLKKKGFEEAKLVEDEEEEAKKKGEGFFDRLFKKASDDDKKKASSNGEDDTVHVFSVASGHLYERFLRIMMLSVKRNTQSKVKFWIIKNFLSPAFMESIDEMGREFGFEVELVQYQWPKWLRGQTEKQRKIWGYKILFLDVLFPLSLKRVIFIDADQVVRTDLKQLMELDMGGKAFGFTPFCEGKGVRKPTEKEIEDGVKLNEDGMVEFARGRSETNGFRFWNSGFWKDHLHGRPYHISALFVVDLDLLRSRGYADQLRATYDQLSRDAGSLANLDQDLPNYLQHAVPIFSLPPEWLWCETWCSDDSKPFAKTIDLCNNPLTKTPKLESALRIIPEWPELDSLTSQFFHAFSSQSSSSSNAPQLLPENPPADAHPSSSAPPSKDEL